MIDSEFQSRERYLKLVPSLGRTSDWRQRPLSFMIPGAKPSRLSAGRTLQSGALLPRTVPTRLSLPTLSWPRFLLSISPCIP